MLKETAVDAFSGGGASIGGLVLVLLLLSGCATVDGVIQPHHFQFVDVVPKRGAGPGGWRAACVHAYIKNGKTRQSALCKFGVEVPMETGEVLISAELARRTSAYVANLTVREILSGATDESPLGVLCEQFKTSYHINMSAALAGSQVMRTCHPLAPPVVFGEPF
jgi:hypothetical protein